MKVPNLQLTVLFFVVILDIYTKFCFIDIP